MQEKEIFKESFKVEYFFTEELLPLTNAEQINYFISNFIKAKVDNKCQIWLLCLNHYHLQAFAPIESMDVKLLGALAGATGSDSIIPVFFNLKEYETDTREKLKTQIEDFEDYCYEITVRGCVVVNGDDVQIIP